MDLGFRVSIPSRDQMFTSQIVKGLELRLQKYMVHAYLIVLPLPEFDIILGMDWLSAHRAVIDFRQSQTPAIPARHFLLVCEEAYEERLSAFLASIVSVTEPVSHRLEDVDVIWEFSGVFPDDVAGIPPDREVDFSIELMRGTMPISKAPYRFSLRR
ncbi:uncharacterized protein [Primulina huaijiensis]|uniref:uncharacterized protein n=1 Tax=Primulina huaijiensis TaxID=1492673 RepID=UPI003CC73E32